MLYYFVHKVLFPVQPKNYVDKTNILENTQIRLLIFGIERKNLYKTHTDVQIPTHTQL